MTTDVGCAYSTRVLPKTTQTAAPAPAATKAPVASSGRPSSDYDCTRGAKNEPVADKKVPASDTQHQARAERVIREIDRDCTGPFRRR